MGQSNTKQDFEHKQDQQEQCSPVILEKKLYNKFVPTQL